MILSHLRIALAAVLLAACVRPAPIAERHAAQPAPPVAEAVHDTLELRVLDVGQGDAILIRNAGRTALVDAGPSDAIAARLKELGVDTVDVLIASHNHADHIGGADAVLDQLPVRFYLDNGHPATTRIQAKVLELVEQKGVTYLQASDRTLSLGDARLRIIPPPAIPDGTGDADQNNRSVTVVLERGTFRALLSGDSETQQINALLAAGAVPDSIAVLKAAHHGSRNAVTPAWLARTRPAVVVISLGAGNSYGHPHEQAMRYYCAGGREVLRTDREGDVVIDVDAQGDYAVHTQRGIDPTAATATNCAAYSARRASPSPYSR
jgi:beta-lactamase superfamily II metal-dependent hydrolase